jgi:hypothetical protein
MIAGRDLLGVLTKVLELRMEAAIGLYDQAEQFHP